MLYYVACQRVAVVMLYVDGADEPPPTRYYLSYVAVFIWLFQLLLMIMYFIYVY